MEPPLQHSRHWIHRKIYTCTGNEGIPAYSLPVSSYSKFAVAELGRNKLHPLTAVSLASTLSRVLGAQQRIQLLISTAPASLFSPPPCHQPQRIPRDVFLCCPFTAAPKETSKSGNKFRSNKSHSNQGRCILFSLAALQQLSGQSLLGPINSRSFF